MGRKHPIRIEWVQDVELDDVTQRRRPLQITKKRGEDARSKVSLRHAGFTRRVLYNNLEALQGVVRLEGHVAAARAQDAVDRRDHGRVPLQQQRDAVVRPQRDVVAEIVGPRCYERVGDRADGFSEGLVGVLRAPRQADRTRMLLRGAEHQVVDAGVLGPRLLRFVRSHDRTQVVVVLDHQVVHGQGVAVHEHRIHIRLRLDEEALRGSFRKEVAPVPQTELAVRGHELEIQERAAEFVCCRDRRLVDGVVRPI